MSATRIAHLSDIHFGRIDPEVVAALHDGLVEAKPDLVVLSGDLTQSAKTREFEEAAEFIRSLPCEVFVIPGNHDLPGWRIWSRFLRPYTAYRRHISEDLEPVYTDKALIMAGLNSTRILVRHYDWSRGRISKRQLRHLEHVFSEKADDRLRVVVLHHPVTRWREGPVGPRSQTQGARRLARTLDHLGVDLVLTGHRHVGVWRDLSASHPEVNRHIVVAEAASAASTRLRGAPNGFNLFEVVPGTLQLRHMTYATGKFIGDHEQKFERSQKGLVPL